MKTRFLYTTLFTLIASITVGCGSDSATVKKTTTTTVTSKATTDNKTETSTVKQTESTTSGTNDANWPTELKEGWVSSSMVQAIYSMPESVSDIELKQQTRERMAWLLLLKDYDLSRNDKHYAEKLAGSSSFAAFGDEIAFRKTENGKKYLALRRTGSGLEKKWQDIQLKMESKLSDLAAKRKTD